MIDTNKTFDYNKAFNWIEAKGKELYGENFALNQSDLPVLHKLVAYFLKDEITANKYGLNMGKGILLTGPIGVGKTSLINILKFFLKNEDRYIVKTCRDISFEFIEDGYNVIHKYSRGISRQVAIKSFCFDDLGVEGSLKYYGNECNVMAEIILSRYDLFISQKLITHITTNLSASEIEEIYGNRIRSRMREMFNLISFEKDAPDKRK
jgi:DNA replication protein DnaC